MPRRRKHPFLTLREGVWYVRKTIKVGEKKVTVKRSTGYSESQIDMAEAVGQEVIRNEQQKLIFGFSNHTWGEAAVALIRLKGNPYHNGYLRLLQPYLENVPLIELHTNHPQLVRFREDRLALGRKNNTINRSLEIVSVVLNFATKLMDGPTPWLTVAPRIEKLPRRDRRRPEQSEEGGYPLNRKQYEQLFKELRASESPILHDMALFALHTGVRARWICDLQWKWERKLPELGSNVFVFELPDSKNGTPMCVFCNSVAREVIDRQRGRDAEYVFVYDGHPITRMTNSAWLGARKRAGLENVFGKKTGRFSRHFRFHDLRVTCSTWLREADVSREDRKAILNHSNDDITTHYSVGEIGYMIELVERIARPSRRPSLYLVKAAG